MTRMPWSKIGSLVREPQYCSEQGEGCRIISYAESIREALLQAMDLDVRVFVMGQGVDDPSGMFGSTTNLHEIYGAARVFDTPLAETALMGVANGAAIAGMRPVYFHNRPDFLYLSMDQLVNHASKWSYMFGGKSNVPLVVWACVGRGWGSAAQHSQAPHAVFMHVPGLKLVMPSTCFDAKGLLLSAIADENPVLVIEHRFNFRNTGNVPQEPYFVPLGKGAIRRSGTDVTIVAISHMVRESFDAALELSSDGIEVELVDPRTLKPLDEEIILDSVKKTGRLLIADIGWKTCGVGSEIASLVVERAFRDLKAPIARISCPDLPTPAGYSLEQAFYPNKNDIISGVISLMEYKVSK